MKKIIFFCVILNLFIANSINSQQVASDDIRELKEEMRKMKTDFNIVLNELRKLKSENENLRKMVLNLPTNASPGSNPPIKYNETHSDLIAEELPKIKVNENMNLKIFGEATGVIQASMGNKPQNTTNAEGSLDLYFESKITQNGIFFVDLEAVGNDGPNSVLGTYSGVNADAGSNNGTVHVLEALYEQSFLSEKFIFSIGKIDLTNYYDTNTVANDENIQFLSPAFVNSAVLDIPGNGPGVTAKYCFTDWLDFSSGIQSGDEDGNFVFDRICWISEFDFKYKINNLDGNTRTYFTLNGNRHSNENPVENDESAGFGLSTDQKLSEKITWFGRVGFRDDHISESETEWAWSSGLQIGDPLQFRPNDVLGIAFGQVKPNREVMTNLKRMNFDLDETGNNQNEKRAGIESNAEVYYRIKINDKFTISPDIQIIFNPSGDETEDNIVITGIRGHYTY